MSTQGSSPLAGPLASSITPAEPGQEAGPARTSDATHSPLEDAPLRRVRLGRRQLADRAQQLSDRDRLIIDTVGRLRLLSADQVRRLFFHELSSKPGAARVCRRVLRRLVEAGALRVLERRVGGVRAGSSGTVYTLTATGRRLVAYWNGHGATSDRGVHEAGGAFIRHTLAIADLYVRVVEADRLDIFELLEFVCEPDCWRTFIAPYGATQMLKPDALVRLAAGDYEHSAFVEIDLDTEGRSALLRKLTSYDAYYRSGREQTNTGLFPLVVFITTTAPRRRVIDELIAGLPDDVRPIFTTTTDTDAILALADDLAMGGEGDAA